MNNQLPTSGLPPLTDDQLSSMSYFWVHKGDLERWCEFSELWPAIQQHHPEVAQAWVNYKAAKKQLTRLLGYD